MGKKKQPKKIQKQPSQQWMMWTLLVIIAASVILIVMKALSGPEEAQPIDQAAFQYEKQPALGSQDAPVKVAEFADFKCPSCQQFDQAILPQLKRDFIDNGTVQYYFLNYPIISPNGDSRTAAMAGEAVYHQNPEEFWKFYEAVFAHQEDENKAWATSETLVKIAKQAKLNLDFSQLQQDIDNQTFSKEVTEDEAIGNQMGVNGTPTIYINGQMLPAQSTFDYNAIKQAIEKAKEGSKQ